MRWSTAMVVALAAFAPAAPAQAPPSQAEVDRAVRRGSDYLLDQIDRDREEFHFPSDPLLFYALLVSRRGSDPRVGRLLRRILESPLDGTDFPVYDVAIRAMALARTDPDAYRTEIARCGWWLVQAQTDNGQWDYDGPPGDSVPRTFPAIAVTGTTSRRPGRRTSSDGPRPTWCRLDRSEPWRPSNPRRGTISRNSSTTQYAALGLYACHLAGVAAPAETWRRLRTFLLGTQDSAGKGWTYIDPDDRGNFWYPIDGPSHPGQTPMYLSSLAILLEIQGGRDADLEESAERGFDSLLPYSRHVGDFLRRMPESDDVPRSTLVYHYYGLYSLERAGLLWKRDRMAGHAWYALGAAQLLQTQGADGAWGRDYAHVTDKPVNTSFALLFLERTVPGSAVTLPPDRPRPDGGTPSTGGD